MREAIVALLIALILSFEARSEELYLGAVYLPIQGYSPLQCSRALRVYRGIRRPALAFLWSSFGDDLRCVNRWLRYVSAKPAMLNIYATNETCKRRPRYCTKYDQPASFDRRMQSISAFVLTALRPGLRIIVHPCGLEDDRSASSCSRRLAIAANLLPNEIELGRNPIAPPDLFWKGFDVREHHRLLGENYTGPRYVYTNDGRDLHLGGTYRAIGRPVTPGQMLSQIYRNRGSLIAVLLWWNNQGAGGPGRRFNEPRRRSYRVADYDVAVVNRMLRRIQ